MYSIDFVNRKLLGSGGFGDVYEEPTGKLALKNVMLESSIFIRPLFSRAQTGESEPLIVGGGEACGWYHILQVRENT